MKQVPLTQGLFATVSALDFDVVNVFKWHASLESRGKKMYAVRCVRDHSKSKVWIPGKRKKKGRWRYPKKKIRMHRFIMGLGTGFEDERVVDHINDDSLDNRRENLSIVTQDENMAKVERWKRKQMKEEECCL